MKATPKIVKSFSGWYGVYLPELGYIKADSKKALKTIINREKESKQTAKNRH